MKNQIRSAQIVLPCADLNKTLEFFVERLGFRVEIIFPADAPQTAVISGYGTVLRLETSSEHQPLTLRLLGDFVGFPSDSPRELSSPDGVRVIFTDAGLPIKIPETTQEFVLTTLEGAHSWKIGRAHV